MAEGPGRSRLKFLGAERTGRGIIKVRNYRVETGIRIGCDSIEVERGERRERVERLEEVYKLKSQFQLLPETKH